MRYGAKAIEFEKGKTAIVVPNKDQLVATIDTVIACVKAGELDEHLAQQAKLAECPSRDRQPNRAGGMRVECPASPQTCQSSKSSSLFLGFIPKSPESSGKLF